MQAGMDSERVLKGTSPSRNSQGESEMKQEENIKLKGGREGFRNLSLVRYISIFIECTGFVEDDTSSTR